MPRVLGLGEDTHGSPELLTKRNELIQQLVEQGYRTVALETDCLMALIADDYVTTGAGDLDDVMEHGFSHSELGAGPWDRELLQWMRSYNSDRPDKLRFIGMDGPLQMSHAAGPRAALTHLRDYLAVDVELDDLIGADADWTNPAAMYDAAASIGRTPAAQRLRVIADDLTSRLDTETPYLIASTSRAEWELARLYARSAVGLLRYHAAMADPVPDRWARLSGIRDAMMAANLLAAAERGPVIVHAHSAHLQRPISTMQMGDVRLEWWSAGALLDAHLGADYDVMTL